MAIHLEEVVRSEVEGGLAGPANPIPSESIDCGCGQLPCPKLARFATRRLFVGLLSWIGLIQAAAYAYLHIVAPTIARRFQFEPTVMEWILVVSDLTPLFLGVVIAFWGDRVHRVAWIGGIVLVQSIAYFSMIIPHLTHQTKVVEETENITHMSIYADDSRELCLDSSSRIVSKEDETCYFTFGLIVVVQIISGIANIAYFALGFSYLDDNTAKKNVSIFIGVLIAVKIMGTLFGSFLAWGCLRIDAMTLSPIESYREQIGAWWLGLPILTVLLIVPGLLLSWFPRMLPSQVVQRAAVSLLTNSGTFNRAPRRLVSQKIGSSNFWPSLGRLFINKTLICQVVAVTLYITAVVNFLGYENLIAQARFHVPRPTGSFLGFDDPDSSRLISNILKPILVGLIVIISGLVIAKAKPAAWSLIIYSIVVLILACGIIFALSAAICDRKPIVGTRKNSLVLLQHCNLNCGCSKDADFRPVCDNKGAFTFYSACHAGCIYSDIKNDITTYSGCSCVEEATHLKGNLEAIDGPCNSNHCQISRIAFEFGILLVYVMVASTFVGDILIILRSVYVQDKSIGIGFWMAFAALFVQIPGKIAYDSMANLTCQHWGTRQSVCRLHDGSKLGNYLSYLTGSLLAVSVLFKILVSLFCKDANIYAESELEATKSVEMQELIENPEDKQRREENGGNRENDETHRVQLTTEALLAPTAVIARTKNGTPSEEVVEEEEAPLKYGPLGPGDRRTDSKSSLSEASQKRKSTDRILDSGDELTSSDDESKINSSPKVEYRPLDIDSDMESDLSNAEPRSRKRIVSKDYDPVYSDRSSLSTAKSSLFRREFPNPDNYDDPRLSRRYKETLQNLDGSSKTSSFEFSKQRRDKDENETQTRGGKGDFNEVGIPITDPLAEEMAMKGVRSLINRYELNSEQGESEDQDSIRSTNRGSNSEVKTVPGIPLVAMAVRKPSSKSQIIGSGGGSLSVGRGNESNEDSKQNLGAKGSNKGSVGTLHTDF